MSDTEPIRSEEKPTSCWNLEPKNEQNTPKTNTTERTDGSRVDAKIQSQSPDCTICYLPISQPQGQVVLEECGHRFHSGCIRIWMKQKRTCPFCAGFSLLPEEYPRL